MVVTLFRLGYVALSVHVQNASSSKTMTYTNFQKIEDREAAIHKLERISRENVQNVLRLLHHNKAHDIDFFRMSSKLIPLATHEDLKDWDAIKALSEDFKKIGDYAKEHKMRVDFHPEHFVVLNTPRKEVFKSSVRDLEFHYRMLHAMGIDPTHRCVLHVGGSYKDKEKSLERFVENWAYVPRGIQKMIMLENDDKVFNMQDCLYLCEKLGVPFVFDLHHHLANHEEYEWEEHWDRVVKTWENSPLPVKMHISSPKDEKHFRSHADYIDGEMFIPFLRHVNQTTDQIDCMLEAKKKDDALFHLKKDLEKYPDVEFKNQASFTLKS